MGPAFGDVISGGEAADEDDEEDEVEEDEKITDVHDAASRGELVPQIYCDVKSQYGYHY